MKVKQIIATAALTALLAACGGNKPPVWYNDTSKAPECGMNYCETGVSESDGSAISLDGAREESRTYALARIAADIDQAIAQNISISQGKTGKTVSRSFIQAAQAVTRTKLSNAKCQYTTTSDNTVYALCMVPKAIDTEILNQLK
jgi:hypothetical protein